MFRTAILVGAMLASACTTTSYVERPDEIRIVFGSGGHVNSVRAKYERIAATRKPVVIDGQVISADAFFAFSLPNVCYTENAVFSPHAASYLGLIPNRQATERLAARLPDPLEQWFKGNLAYHDWIGFARVEYDELRRIWPEGDCGAQRMAMTATTGG